MIVYSRDLISHNLVYFIPNHLDLFNDRDNDVYLDDAAVFISSECVVYALEGRRRIV